MPPAGLIQLVASFPSLSGMSADTVENVVHLGDNGIPDADLTDCMEAFRDFYTVDSGAGQANAVQFYLSGTLSAAANACKITAYKTSDLSGATPFGAPYDQIQFTLTPSAGYLPEEVAVCLSLHANLAGIPETAANPTPPPAIIRPAARRRGRLYIGPMGNGAGTVAGGRYRPGSLTMADIGVAFGAFCNTVLSETAAVAYVGIWSRADEDVYAVVGGYVDNAWDTQRRRGPEATSRTSWTI